jgi:hypothetical protein
MHNFLVYADDVDATLSVLDRIVEWAQAGQAARIQIADTSLTN